MSEHIYHRTVDPQGQDSIAKIAGMISSKSVVLDLGSGPGILARYLTTEKKCIVDGVELSKTQAELGRQWFRKLVVGDLESIGSIKQFQTQVSRPGSKN